MIFYTIGNFSVVVNFHVISSAEWAKNENWFILLILFCITYKLYLFSDFSLWRTSYMIEEKKRIITWEFSWNFLSFFLFLLCVTWKLESYSHAKSTGTWLDSTWYCGFDLNVFWCRRKGRWSCEFCGEFSAFNLNRQETIFTKNFYICS